ncbi:LamG-like jellyroll fold domain-containing protein [Curtobacterium oceanosedimentum]|uniref:LamG-like jellyroll fold domain-containing protein n=1 Tax=Curtobacterium oceanosedimentum TaxID=465820 RepID=UPI001CE0481F|nr:LamG-like jellyroll fold domain-containing protein [Curtobacterium oceanosedimentum]MCA5924451.1 hypothetical protein [Curtobacterium oceanosedimentum]
MSTTVTRRPVRCVGELPRLLLAVVARTALWTVLLLAVWAALPAALGWHLTTVVSDSMAPGIRTGDVVAAVPTDGDAVETGRVLLVDDPDHDDRLRLHRLARIEQDGGLRLRGDANPSADRTTVAPDAVLGVGVLRFPVVGLPGVWIRTGDWAALVSVCLGVGAAVLLSRLDRDLRAGRPCPTCGVPRWEPGAPPIGVDVTAAPRAALPALAAVVLIALVGSTTGATFSGTTASGASFGASLFPCFHGPTNGAVLAWDFSEKAGDVVVDRSGHGRDAVLRPSVVRVDGSCGANPFADFRSGSADTGVVHTRTAQAAPETFALELWFKTATQGRLLGFSQRSTGPSGAYDRNFYVGPDGRLAFGVWDGSVAKVTQSAARVDDGTWHHAVGQFTSGRLELWLDGTRVAARTDAASAAAYSGYWRAGSGVVDPTWPNAPTSTVFTGSMDTVRVHDQLLTASTIREHHTVGR